MKVLKKDQDEVLEEEWKVFEEDFNISNISNTRCVALMIQLGKFVGGWWLTPTTYIQLAGAGSIFYILDMKLFSYTLIYL